MAPGESSQAQPVLKRKFELLDPDIFECPICSEDLAPPVYQCPSGHTMCAACWEKIGGSKCPSCQKRMGNNQCIAVEKILESLLVSWKNNLHGFPRMLGYTRRAEHESTSCEYHPFNCLFDGCKFEGSIHSLTLHFKEKHQLQTLQPNGQFTMTPTDDYIVVHDGNDHLFVVHREKQNLLGDKFPCACFGTFPGWLKLVVRVKDGPRRSYTLETEVANVREGDEWKRNFLLVPESAHGLVNCEFQGQLDVQVVIEKTFRLSNLRKKIFVRTTLVQMKVN